MIKLGSALLMSMIISFFATPDERVLISDSIILNLSEETKEALNNEGAQALVIGSFAPGRYNVYISLRVVKIDSQHLIATTDFSVPIGPDVKILLKPKDPEPSKDE